MDSSAGILRDCVRRALVEDLGCADLALDADVTSTLSIAPGRRGQARLLARAAGVLAGVDCAVQAFRLLDAASEFDVIVHDGERFSSGDQVLRVRGDMRALLAAERTALNFVQRLAGIATRTRAFVDAVAHTAARILDTRKTTPGLRMLEKQAVRAGGGHNHRFGLYDQVLLKENHFGFARPSSYEQVVHTCAMVHPGSVVAEARNLAEALSAVRGGAAVVLLDNFSPGEALRAVVATLRQEARTVGREVAIEASGGIDLRVVAAFAECGVDRISVGALTHSAPVVDMSLLVEGVD